MAQRIELKIWQEEKRDPFSEDHFRVLSGKVMVASKSYQKLLAPGEGLRIAWPYSIIAYEKAVVEFL